MSVIPSDLLLAAVCAALAGAAMPLGALVARMEHIRPAWLETEFRHSVIAFGGGVLFAAIALVLVPEGRAALTAPAALSAFGAGGLFFFLVDRLIERRGGAGAQLMAMLLDFVPESLALGATFAAQKSVGLLLTVLIALQNLPEGFNAYRELRASGRLRPRTILIGFSLLALLGPLVAAIGHVWLRDLHEPLGALMLFAAGGIFYLIFEDIAPQAKLEYHWAPPLGAVAGFMLGMAGDALIG
ncbi:MAG: divalent cation transporter [Kiloniellaceae bacterium]